MIERANHLAAEASAASATKGEFLANMSHEIRAPMTAILGSSENLLDPELRESDRLSAISTIRRNAEFLLQIVDDILDLSKIESGKLHPERIECPLFETVTDVCSLMRMRASQRRPEFNVEYIGAVPSTILSDPVRLRQILINLIGNAVEFTENGGVRLVVRLIQDPGDGPKIQFDVADTGIGMTGEQVSRLFSPLTRAVTSTTRRFGGTGPGLVIGKRLAEILGGDIRVVSSQPGSGTCFCATAATGSLDGVAMVELATDACVTRPEVPGSDRSAPLPARIPCCILLAEDGPDNQRLITFILKKAGAGVAVAENGRVAVE